MSKEKIKDKGGYKELNTPIVTQMLNLMQWVYGDPHIRGSYDRLFVEDKEVKVPPIFSAFQAFIISTALCMRKPGEEKIPLPTDLSQRQILENIDRIISMLENLLQQPHRTMLIQCLEKYIINGKFDTKAISDEEAHLLFNKKPN